jgi:aminocarboxymuconate-semialdehyde decarboxylase
MLLKKLTLLRVLFEGFPMETTVAVSRLIVSGVVDQFPDLKLLISHAGAALPSLIGRLDSCVEHDWAVCDRLKHAPSEYLKRFYYDAISYGDPALDCLVKLVGHDRIMFGTDNPFFAPLAVPHDQLTESDVVWPSTQKVRDCVIGLGDDAAKKVLSENATRILNL